MRSFLLLLLLALIPAQTLFAQTSWKGTVSTNWSTASNWTAGVPTSSIDAIIGDVNFTGSFHPTMTSGNTVFCRALTIGTGAVACTLSVGRNINCYGDVTIGSNGTILQNTNSRIITVKGNWTNNGNYAATGTNTSVTFSGSAQIISGTTNFRSITINSGTTVTLGTNLAVSTTLSISGTLDPTANHVVSGTSNLTVNSGGTLLVKAATFAGNYAITGIVSLNGRSTVNYASSSINQNISAAYTYGYLRISGGTTKFLTANLPALSATSSNSGRVYVDAGTFDLQSFTANRGTTVSGGYFIVAIGATMKIGGSNEFPQNYSYVSVASNSTVNYCGTNQVIRDYNYGNLVFESSAGVAIKTM
ncbi:MAG TPA: hypothetical protein VK826_20140, partial [Bacteroidia bacterium]|nr:hypothetical protein [Bacteroidia bacterium]